MPQDDAPFSPLSLLAGLLAVLFGAIVRLRNAAYKYGLFRVVRVERPVISVGNIAVGGRGKTPFTILLAKRLSARGLRVAVISRGYGRKRKGLVVVAKGEGPLVEASVGGDEPVMIARCTNAAVVVCADRARAAKVAIDELGAEVLLMDDGFQHRRLGRDLDIVMLDGQRPMDNRKLLPAGPLREPPQGLKRAQLLVLNDGKGPGLSEDIPKVEVVVVPTEVGLLEGKREGPEVLEGMQVGLLSAIARPHRFEETVRSLGAKVVFHDAHPDHHYLSGEEVQRFKAGAHAAGAERLLTTEKDAVRLPAMLREDVYCLFVEQRIVSGESALDAALDAALAPRG